jgi:hypothetical protein
MPGVVIESKLSLRGISQLPLENSNRFLGRCLTTLRITKSLDKAVYGVSIYTMLTSIAVIDTE